MDIGLYQIKYPARKVLSWFLPVFKHLHPNTISLLVLLPGSALAVTLWMTGHVTEVAPYLWWSLLWISVRMFLGTMDGLVAQTYNKESALGEIINRLAPEVSDILYLSVLAYLTTNSIIGLAALGIAWFTTFCGLLGLVIQKPIQSVGPVGQTDRLFIFMAFIVYALASNNWQASIDNFLIVTMIGGSITCLLRLYRILK